MIEHGRIDDGDVVWGRVDELDAFHGGDRLRVMLLPDDEGPPIRLELRSPPKPLGDAITLGARVGCRTYEKTTTRGRLRVAFWVEAVQRRVGHDRWIEVWHAPEEFVPRDDRDRPQRAAGEARGPEPLPEVEYVDRKVTAGVVRRRPLDPEAAAKRRAALHHAREGEVVGTLAEIERLPEHRTAGLVIPDDGGPPIELQLRRAPSALVAALRKGARLRCVAAPHRSDPHRRFSAHVISVESRDRETWRHAPQEAD